MQKNPIIPVIILTGFLGSGKTQFLSRLLKDKQFKNSAVIINEFGEIGLDHLLVKKTNDQIFDLPNGCLCCSAKGALIEQMLDLANQRENKQIQFDRLIIETSGIADALNLSQFLGQDPDTGSHYHLSKIITIVSATETELSLSLWDEISSQLTISDLILISKSDLLPISKRNEALARIVSAIELSNTGAEISTLPLTPKTLNNILSITPEINRQKKITSGSLHNVSKFQTISLTTDQPVSSATIDNFLDLVLSKHGNSILRIKGLSLITGKENQPMVVQSVKSTISPHYFLDQWQVQPRTSLTFIFTDNQAQSITDIFQAVFNILSIDQADNLALSNNPLSIPGIGKFKF